MLKQYKRRLVPLSVNNHGPQGRAQDPMGKMNPDDSRAMRKSTSNGSFNVPGGRRPRYWEPGGDGFVVMTAVDG